LEAADVGFWAFWNILIPIAVPVGGVWLYFRILDQRRRIYQIIRDGQICLVCIILAAGTWFDITEDVPPLKPAGEAIKEGAVSFLFVSVVTSFIIYCAALNGSKDMTTEVERNIGLASTTALILTAVVIIYCRAYFGLVK